MTSTEIWNLRKCLWCENGPHEPVVDHEYKRGETALACVDMNVNRTLTTTILREAAESPKTTRHHLNCRSHKDCMKKKWWTESKPYAILRPMGERHTCNNPGRGTQDAWACKPCQKRTKTWKAPALPARTPTAWYGSSLNDAYTLDSNNSRVPATDYLYEGNTSK